MNTHTCFSPASRQGHGSPSLPRWGLVLPRLAYPADAPVITHLDSSSHPGRHSPKSTVQAGSISDRGPRIRTATTTRCSALPEKGGGSGQGRQEVDPTSLEAAADSMETIWDLACRRDEDALLSFIPEGVLEQAAQLRIRMERGDPDDPIDSQSASDAQPLNPQQPPKQQQQQQRQDRRPVTLLDVVTQAHGMSGFAFDSFAVRHLYVSPPTRGSVSRLSCIRTASDRAVLRYAVAEEGGERAVLTFGLECEERLAPHYRSARVEYVWQLISVTGEAMEQEAADGGLAAGEDGAEAAEAPTRGPHPSLPPEAVTQAQLDALACEDVARVFAFASPSNRAVTGPLERFAALLRNPLYRPLLRHRAAQVTHMAGLRPGQHSAVVRVVSANTGLPQEVEMVFYWLLSRQRPDAEPPFAGCWMTDSVELISARPLGGPRG